MVTTKKTPETEANKASFTDYQVAFDAMGRHVEIILDGHKPSEGHRIIGSFSANAVAGTVKGDEDFDRKGEHVLIAGAKKILSDLEITDFDNMAYEDKASNAPQGNEYVLTHAEREEAIRNGQDPAERQAAISANLSKANAAEDKPRKAGTRKKNDAGASTKK